MNSATTQYPAIRQYFTLIEMLIKITCHIYIIYVIYNYDRFSRNRQKSLRSTALVLSEIPQKQNTELPVSRQIQQGNTVTQRVQN